MVRAPICSLPNNHWDFLKILPPAETARGQVFCLRTPTQKGPDAEVVFAGKWDTKDAIRNKKRWVNSPYDFPHCLDPSLRKDHMSFSYWSAKEFFLFYRSQVAADWASHPSLLISDDEEEPPVLSPQKPVKDVNGNLLKDNEQNEQDPHRAPNMDSEIKELLNGVARRLMPDAVGQIPSKPTSRSKAMEFSAKLMGLPAPEQTSHIKAWTEHPILQLSREEVNSRFSEMPYGLDSEKRLGCPPPSVAAKIQTTAAAETLSGADMSRLPHALRTEIPKGAKIETVEMKSKLPRAVEEESTALLWNSVRNLLKNFIPKLCIPVFCFP